MRARAVDRTFQTATSTTRSCQAPGCYQTTRENKPFCSQHVERHPYVQGLLAILDERDQEQEAIRERGPSAVDLEGLMAQELMLHLALHGSRTLERLCREFQLDRSMMRSYIDALKYNGKIVLGRSLRGSVVVRLNGPASKEVVRRLSA